MSSNIELGALDATDGVSDKSTIDKIMRVILDVKRRGALLNAERLVGPSELAETRHMR